jgi:hypothetical protein
VVEQTISVDQDLFALAAYVFKLWHELPEV